MAFKPNGALDPRKPLFASLLGKKGSGKSILARLLFDSYPYDRVVIDVNGDDGPAGEGVITLDEPPARWPESQREDREPMTLRYVPDAGSKTFVQDMDAVVGMAYAHGRCAVLIHEMGVLAEANKTPEHTRRALHQGRHRALTLIMCAPRPVTMDPLVIAQSDLVYVFKLPNPADRRRVADVIGWDPSDFDAAVNELGQHEYLRYDDSAPEPEPGQQNLKLLHFPALPRDVAGKVRTGTMGRVPAD